MRRNGLNDLIDEYNTNPNEFLKQKDKIKRLINLLIYYYQKGKNIPKTKLSAFIQLYLEEIYNKKDIPFYYEKVLIHFLNGDIKNKEIEPFIFKNKKKNLLYSNGTLLDLVTEKPYKTEINIDKLISLIETYLKEKE